MQRQDGTFYAHTSENMQQEQWQKLQDHLQDTAKLAAQMAGEFGCGEWGYIAGLWHDLGKYQPGFQQRLLGDNVKVEHSGIGAAWSYKLWKADALPLAFAIAGHHAGLANLMKSDPGLPTPLIERLNRNKHFLESLVAIIPELNTTITLPKLPPFLQFISERGSLRRSMEFWIRFLCSVLVDADRLDSEAFEQPEKARLRLHENSITEIGSILDAYIKHKIESISPQLKGNKVNQARQRVLAFCRTAAEKKPGIFSLSVPTGGGKTLSSMSFALHHAEINGLKRVIVVVPYTSIIEQNAREYKQALGETNVIEHHSNFDPEQLENSEDQTRWHLATENWDSPVIVTTSVEFLETLFSSHPSRIRKLHNIARSVVVFDEVQLLPPGFLISILDAIRELVQHYGCSIVLSTATQPAFSARTALPQGLTNIMTIVPETENLNTELKRVSYHWPEGNTPIQWSDLARELASHDQAMAIVHRRKDARDVTVELGKLSNETVYHLSALMCPAHRLKVINEIKIRLQAKEKCRVVSTQLVEAGVDFDFPIVYRALAGLDSIIQAAGRCNREGQAQSGKVILFRAPTSPPPGTLRKALQTTEALLNSGTFEPDNPIMIEKYFRMLYQKENLDNANIQREREELNFATVGRDFHLIEDGFTENIIVPWGKAPRLLQDLKSDGPSRDLLRRLQPFVVGVYPNSFQELRNAGVLIEIAPSLYALAPGFEKQYYSDVFGLVAGDETGGMPALMI